MNARFALIAAVLTASACAGSADAPSVSIAVTAGGAEAKVDGQSVVELTATVTPLDAVVSFTSAAGLLSATDVRAVGGTAVVTLMAPFEFDVLDAKDVVAQVSAAVSTGDASAQDAVDVTFVYPTSGAPRLSAHTDPDRIVTGAAFKLIIEGTFLEGTTATLHSDSAGLVLPESVELTVDGVTSGRTVDLVAPDVAGNVVVDIAVGSVTRTATLSVIGEDDAAFDLTGDFVQIVHGATTVSNFFLLDGDNQCAVATSISLAHIEQDGAHLKVTTESCQITMPEMKLQFVGVVRPETGAGFVQAANDNAGAPMEHTLPSVAANAPFNPPASAFEPLVVGVDLANPATDALPTDPNDSRVTDDDHDGHPGVTVTAYGDRYTIYRTKIVEMNSTIQSSNRIEGTALAETETIIFGEDSNGGPVMTPHPSKMLLLRLDGKNSSADFRRRDGIPTSLSCADVNSWALAELENEFPAPGNEACE